jgi:pimeloyl-ACP methyl ester carboxylesterase
MAKLAQLLSDRYRTIAVDWPGFGDRASPYLDYAPPLYHQFLADFVRDLDLKSLTILAAGHAAGYAIELGKQNPQSIAKLILVAPTWRGPLPTMMGGSRPWLKNLQRTIDLPMVGQFLYRLNTTEGFLRFMYRRHVYVDESKLTREFMASKRQITDRVGARYGAAAFVTGGLDPYRSREEAIDHLGSLSQSVIIVIAANSPPKSAAEMEALAQLPNVNRIVLPGTLGMYEEYATELAACV